MPAGPDNPLAYIREMGKLLEENAVPPCRCERCGWEFYVVQTCWGINVMPKKLHDELEEEARKKGLKGERKDAYVFGTMRKVEKAKKSKRK